MKKFCILCLAMILCVGCLPAMAKTDTCFDVNDLSLPSNLNAQQLEAGLLGNLKPMAWAFVQAEKIYGVNAVFLASLAGLESGWGKHCYVGENNLFGFGRKDFASYGECIFFVAQKLRQNYLNGDGCYYNGESIWGVNVCYNGQDVWVQRVAGVMNDIARRVQKAA